MQPIPFAPSRIDVVKEVLRKSEEFRIECGELVLPVSFDLAIAKPALQVQCEEAPDYNQLFKMFGQFHTELNIFSAIGKIIEGSGGPSILSEAAVIAPGSIPRFLKGKMYNRCRRGHMLLSAAFRGLHFSEYTKQKTLVTHSSKN